ncbi:DUF6488 family protein [Thalassotalea sp. PP2-459]|uniref:DUF6488 family protein n=1 Tax=Thalassotalea sp. PP2-459 TaxID=1742724 RepID=UPI000941FE34|nr:DUF6488 family protein [Thalassotalea sp. PP2-459]OKY27813.1 hypothetical protein BI291_07830 [Thalassotalea sp. PP2-459]
MKTLKKLAVISTLLFTTSAFAHGDGHSEVDKKKILQAAQTSAKTLTFKDKGMSVGKLDGSWNKVAKDSFKFVEETKEAIIVKAMNNENNQTIYFKISKAGKVLDVKDESSFKDYHGHSH